MTLPRFVLDDQFGQVVHDTYTGLHYRAGKRSLIKLLNEVAAVKPGANVGFVAGSEAIQNLPDNPFQSGTARPASGVGLFWKADDVAGGRVSTVRVAPEWQTTAEIGPVTFLATTRREAAAYEVHEGLRRCLSESMPWTLRAMLWVLRRACKRRKRAHLRHARNVQRCVAACERAAMRWIDLHTLQADTRHAVIDERGKHAG